MFYSVSILNLIPLRPQKIFSTLKKLKYAYFVLTNTSKYAYVCCQCIYTEIRSYLVPTNLFFTILNLDKSRFQFPPVFCFQPWRMTAVSLKIKVTMRKTASQVPLPETTMMTMTERLVQSVLIHGPLLESIGYVMNINTVGILTLTI